MNLSEFQSLLRQHSDQHIAFEFPGGEILPRHFHVTEIGKVTKDFVDCGGTRRRTSSCRIQTWVASDVDHRLTTQKLGGIIDKSTPLELDEQLPVQVEAQLETIGIFDISGHRVGADSLVFQLQSTQTACLAPETCGLEILSGGDCGEPGCC